MVNSIVTKTLSVGIEALSAHNIKVCLYLNWTTVGILILTFKCSFPQFKRYSKSYSKLSIMCKCGCWSWITINWKMPNIWGCNHLYKFPKNVKVRGTRKTMNIFCHIIGSRFVLSKLLVAILVQFVKSLEVATYHV